MNLCNSSARTLLLSVIEREQHTKVSPKEVELIVMNIIFQPVE